MVAVSSPRSLFAILGVLLGVTFTQRASPEQTLPKESPNPRERPVAVPKNCTTGGCHAEVKRFAVLHGPLTVDSCAGCHRLADPEKHTFEMTREGNRLCLFCHQIEAGKVSHLDKAKGSCVECHAPHGARQKGLLRTKSTQELCLQCHEKDMEQGKKMHRPVAAGGCMACHTPHVSDHPKLLLKDSRLLCLDCHVTLSHRLEWSQTVHEPVNKGCLDCHNAHASDHDMLLTSPRKALCLSCHDEVRSTVENARTAHGALVVDRQCLNCHDAHATSFPRLLRDNPRSLCLECHDEAIETPQGTIANIGKVLATGKSLHGPIAADNCSACHQIHGGDRFRLLVKEYPAEFYAPFREESYALCFSCHERSIVLTPRTTALTNFRNGDLNLHFVHVNRKTKGRTCRACHETHASDRAKHVRDSVPFGDWQLPVGFEKTETGGTCNSGCHLPLPYDRQKPAKYEHGKEEPFVDWPAREKKKDEP